MGFLRPTIRTTPPEVYEEMRLLFVYCASPYLAHYVVQKHRAIKDMTTR